MDSEKGKRWVSAPVRSSREPITLFNRETGAYEIEAVYGEAWLRWAYENPLGRLSMWALAKRAWFSRWYGRRMATPASRTRIAPFLSQFKIDPADFLKDPDAFESFNDFFTRELKEGRRPVAPDPRSVVFPADGRHLGFQNIDSAPGVYAKGQRLDIAALLRPALSGGEAPPAGATVVISRLCPVDYHRFHFAVGGKTGPAVPVPGHLFSVSPLALRRNLNYLLENKREITRIEHPDLGLHWQVEVGATNVGSIVQTYTPGASVPKGTEKGFFAFGGSCVVTLFPPDRVSLAPDLLKHTADGIELYAKMGTPMATLAP